MRASSLGLTLLPNCFSIYGRKGLPSVPTGVRRLQDSEDPGYTPARGDPPEIMEQEAFSLGIYRASDVSLGYGGYRGYGGCLEYSNETADSH